METAAVIIIVTVAFAAVLVRMKNSLALVTEKRKFRAHSCPDCTARGCSMKKNKAFLTR
jgi:hypothetical protein